MKYSIKDWGKGLNADALPSELEEGFCSSCTNVRFRDGFAERVLGYLPLKTLSSSPVNIYFLDLFRPPGDDLAYAIAVKSLSSSSGSSHLISAVDFSSDGVYTETNVTPTPVAGAAISSITYSLATATVTTGSAHGLIVGSLVAVSGVTPSGYNTAGARVVSVPSTTTFTYQVTPDPGGPATVMGSYTILVSSRNGELPASAITGGSFVGNYILNLPFTGLYYWNGSTATDFAPVSGAHIAKVSRPFKNYIVQLGPTINGTTYRKMVLWSNAAEPGTLPTSFTAANTNDAGSVELAETSGDVIDCCPWGDVNIVFLDDGRYAMRLTNGNDVFSFTRLPGSEGLYAAGCVANTPAGQVFITPDRDIRIHSGGESRSISQGRVRSLMSSGTTFTHGVATHHARDEVWIRVDFDRVLIWNWRHDTWGVKNRAGNVLTYIQRLASGNGGEYSDSANILLACNTTTIFEADADDQDDSESFDSVIERSGLDLGDADTIKNLQRSRWNFDGASGATYSIQHGSAMTADGTPTYSSAATYTLGTTDYAATRATGGRYLAVKVTWTTTSTTSPGRVRSCDLDWTPGGKR